MEQINIEEIMEQIREEIKEKGYTADMLSFEDLPMHEECDVDILEQMRSTFYLEWRRPLPSGIKGIIKRIICKCIGFVVAPITEDQTMYNRELLSLIEQQNLLMDKQQKEMKDLEKIIKNLNERILILEGKK